MMLFLQKIPKEQKKFWMRSKTYSNLRGPEFFMKILFSILSTSILLQGTLALACQSRFLSETSTQSSHCHSAPTEEKNETKDGPSEDRKCPIGLSGLCSAAPLSSGSQIKITKLPTEPDLHLLVFQTLKNINRNFFDYRNIKAKESPSPRPKNWQALYSIFII